VQNESVSKAPFAIRTRPMWSGRFYWRMAVSAPTQMRLAITLRTRQEVQCVKSRADFLFADENRTRTACAASAKRRESRWFRAGWLRVANTDFLGGL